MRLADAEVRARVARVEGLLEQLEQVADEPALDAVQALVEIYGEALARIVDRGAAGPWVDDELLAHLLLLHGLHPDDVAVRVGRALDEVRPYLRSHGGNVELVGVADGVVRLRLDGSCHGCPSSAATLRLAVEEAVRRAAPEIERVEADGAVASAALPPGAGIAGWTVARDLPAVGDGAVLVHAVEGQPVLFLRLGESLYAYRHACLCGATLAGAALAGTALRCAACERRFDVRRAGRCLDAPELRLEPIPLVAGQGGVVKVALPAEAR